MTFAQCLRERMHAQGVNQKNLSEHTGLSKGAISQYVNGITKPTPNNATLLAQALNCSVEDFFDSSTPRHDDYETPEIPLAEAALLLGMTETRLKARLRQPGCFYGDAVQINGNHYDYYINRNRLLAYLLILQNEKGLLTI